MHDFPGRFREDLYYRLNGMTIELPELKDRDNDVLIMANIFLKSYAAQIEREIQGCTPEAEEAIQAYPWPGNIRQLINHIRRAVVLAEDPWVTAENLALGLSDYQVGLSEGLGLKDARDKFQAKLVAQTLAKYRGNVWRH